MFVTHPLLNHIAHRPYPVPQKSWAITQTWLDLLFMHWSVDMSLLRPLIPDCLTIDSFHGTAWVTVIPFSATNVRFRNMPPLPFLNSFLELNVRSYVQWQGKSGVFLFSIDASNPLIVQIAKTWFCLKYFQARISKCYRSDSIAYLSERKNSSTTEASFQATCRPITAPSLANPGTLESWLTERYCFFTVNAMGQLVRGELHHKPWPLQKAEVSISKNSLLEVIGIQLSQAQPLAHFVQQLETIVWSLERA